MDKKVIVLNTDWQGNFWREELPVNQALVKLLRFVRENAAAHCTIELRTSQIELLPRPPVVNSSGKSGIAPPENAGSRPAPIVRNGRVVSDVVVKNPHS